MNTYCMQPAIRRYRILQCNINDLWHTVGSHNIVIIYYQLYRYLVHLTRCVCHGRYRRDTSGKRWIICKFRILSTLLNQHSPPHGPVYSCTTKPPPTSTTVNVDIAYGKAITTDEYQNYTTINTKPGGSLQVIYYL